MIVMETQTRAALEVIERTGECADTTAIRKLMAWGLIVEKSGKLVLTKVGLSEI